MNPFNELPENFFSPLASPHKRHYARLLLIYFDLFKEYSRGVERELVTASFTEYFQNMGEEFQNIKRTIEDEEGLYDQSLFPEEEKEELFSPRNLATRFLRGLIKYGWMSEEVQRDFTQEINLTSWAKPFYKALAEVAAGLEVEYESHVIGIYSSLCSDAASTNGHHAVLNAHAHTLQLIDSLKVLAQNIRTHIDRLFHREATVKQLLHIHYDVYMQEIVDKAYNRLKTSDNLSKYRPLITRTITGFLQDERWQAETAAKLALIKRLSLRETGKLLRTMLKEIRDSLRSIDPILEEIDDKNRQYSGISTEKIKARLYADASLQGKVRGIIKQLIESEGLHSELPHHLVRGYFLARESFYKRHKASAAELVIKKTRMQEFDIQLLEREMLMRIEGQLNPEKIAAFLEAFCPADGSAVPAAELVEDMESFIRVIYAAAYAEGRALSFPYGVKWETQQIRKLRFAFRNHSFFLKRRL